MDKATLVKKALASRKKPSTGISVKKKTTVVKEAQSGKDMGKKNVPGKTGFNSVEENAEGEGMNPSSAKKVAGAVFWKSQKRS